ncbi:uncharacterized protein LOC126893996 isoform X2 [Daktulosphaira vitifoliae]|uniref:uncharacterized protein LOC126893996 isoform X2 n=1 Tax=Daktulosphaira vitifoliae TaxID=58002 RepID=UPI0021A9846F|nr:uncharacterized protein LOC126893996 isoform X2 [Daktulosphaira vitifoliae]
MDQPSEISKKYELLNMSESESSSSVYIPSPKMFNLPRKKKYRKHHRDKLVEHVNFDTCHLQTRTICVFFVLSALIVWLLAMSWYISALQNELDKFNHTIVTMAAGNLGVPDDLQKCHAMSKQLQQNQTVIRQHVIEFKDKMDNLTQRIEKLQDGLSSVEGRIPTIPLTSPGAMRDLSKTVASFGSEIKDISNNVNSLKESSVLMQSNYNKLQFNITAINNTLSNLSGVKNDESFVNNMSEKFTSQLNNLSVNLTSVNSTLTSKFDWVSGDQKSNRVEIEKLKENSQRLISQVKTIESECQASKDKINKLSSDVDSKLSYLKIQIENITENVTNLHVMSKPENISKNSSQLKGTNINSSLSKP